MTRQIIAETLAERLYQAETAVDRALGEVAELAALLPRARSEALLSAVVGQKAFDGAAGALVALTQSRRELVGTHHALGALARKLNIDVSATGPIDKPDDDPPVGGGAGFSAETRPSLNKSLPLD